MNRRVSWRVIVTLVLAVTLAGTGCAKKAVKAPPTPPPAPTTQNTPPTPPPDTTHAAPPTPATTSLTASDLEPAFFDLDSYALRDDARAALDRDAKTLRDHRDAKITIEGHCDERGTAEYNQALGERRANAAKVYLVSAGIDASRIQTVSYGKERPFDPGHDEAAWSKNRRAQIVVP